jgi:hypothetical protein
MGGGPDKEHMVIVLWDEEPKQVTDEIKRRFPYINVTYFCLRNSSKPQEDHTQRVPKGFQLQRLITNTLLSSSELDPVLVRHRGQLLGMF